MPIIPEKRQLEDHVQRALSAQFWSQGIESARSLTGYSCTAPGEPQPLSLNTPSGLSRTQFLVAAHAVRVPVFPSYCEEHGGTVVDRVLLQSGGQKWWAALTGRVKVQRAVLQRSSTTLAQNLSDPDNYALSATGRLQLSDTTSLKATLHADSLQQLPQLQLQQRLFPGIQQQRGSSSSGGSSSNSNKSPYWSRLGQGGSVMLQLKQQLEWLDLTADLAVNEPSIEGVRRYSSTPLRLAVDLAPNSSSTMPSMKNSGKLKSLLFRVGLHGAVAPVEDAAAGHAAAGSSSAGASIAAVAAEQQQHALSVHCQGAVAVTADKMFWEAKQKPWQAAAEAAAAQHKRNKQQRQQQQAAPSAGSVALPVQPMQLQDTNHGHIGSSDAAAAAAAAAAAPSTAAGSALSSVSSGATTSQHKAGAAEMRSKSHQPQTGKTSSSSSSSRAAKHGSSKKQYLTLNGQEIPLPLCSPAAVQEGLQETHHSIERLRTDLRHWTAKVESGELQRLGASRKPTGLLVKEPGSCWSSFLPAPHFKVCGLVGLLGRLPLQQTLLLPGSSSSSSSSRHQHLVETSSRKSSSGSLEGSTAAAAAAADPQQPGGRGSTLAVAEAGSTSSGSTAQAVRSAPSGKPLSHKARSFLAASATQLDRLVVGGARKLGSNILQDTVLRVFASGGACLQLGEMRGNFLDYTRIEAMLDLGLNALETQPLPSSTAAAAAAVATTGKAAAVKGGRGSAFKKQQQQRMPAAPRGLGSVLGPAAASAGVTLPAVGLSQQQQQQRHVPASAVGDGGSAAGDGPSPAVGFGSSLSRPAAPVKQSKHPAFALEDSGVWHSLTLSASQQLLGPMRLRGDWRLALDSSVPCPRGLGGFLAPKAPLQLLQHIAGVRPVVVDSSYGVDVVVPGAGGLVRLVGWYSPSRGEGRLELRLM